MMFFPRALSSISDAKNSLARLSSILSAQLRTASLVIDNDLKWGLQLENATFEWEEAPSTESNKDHSNMKEGSQPNLLPFRVHDITMHVQRRTLVAIVGRVGSGKSSLLSGIVGQMRKVSGSVTFGGRVAYCSQTAWIQNATLVCQPQDL